MKKPIIAEIVSIGTEILLGEIIDTNASFISTKLSERGILVYRKNTVGDNQSRLSQVLREALDRADIVITTGGLGPTEDDITREAIAEVFAEEPKVDSKLLENLKSMFQARGRAMPGSNEKQAWLIDCAEGLDNPFGTACGWCVNKDEKTVFALPGPPSEMKKMWNEQVEQRLPKTELNFYQITIHTSGIGEASLAEKIAEFTNSKNPGIGTYARDNGVDVRVASMAPDLADSKAIVTPVAEKIEALLADFVYGRNGDTIVKAIRNILQARKQSFAIMESVTGGGIATEVTDCPGISSCFRGAIIAYTSEAKTKFGVPQDVIEKSGVVSKEVAEQMAICAKKVLGAEWGISTTGVAGPDSHGDCHPGVAWIAVSGPNITESVMLDWPGDREMVRKRVRRSALQMFWDFLRRTNHG